MTEIAFRQPVRLDRTQLWNGLVRKAADPARYISAITACKVIEEYPDGLLREIVVRDTDRHTERVTFQPPSRVVFDQVTDSALRSITNVIEEDLSGGLHLALVIEGDPARLAQMYDYFEATLAEIVTVLHHDVGAAR